MSCVSRQARHKIVCRLPSTRPSLPDPLGSELKYAWGSARYAHSHKRSAVAGSIQVINEELCDDALKLLAPSLLKYRGCNIIDFFPGQALWSRKVHDLVQPRRHVLIETPEDFNQVSLQPLLDKPDSPYRFRALEKPVPTNPGFYNDVIGDFDIPEQALLGNVDLKHNILVLATLTRLPKRQSSRQLEHGAIIRRAKSPAEPFVYNFLRHLQMQTGPHSFGPARLLFWTFDRDKFTFLPRTVAGIKPVPLEVEEAFIPQEIVGSAKPPQARRPAKLELESSIGTARRMHLAGITLPLNRQSQIHQSILKHASLGKADQQMGTFPVDYLTSMFAELNDLEVRWSLDLFEQSRKVLGSTDKRRKKTTDDYVRMTEILSTLRSLIGEPHDTDSLQITDPVHKALACRTLLHEVERAKASGGNDTYSIHSPQLKDATSLTKYDLAQLTERVTQMSEQLDRGKLSVMHRLSDDHEALFRDTPLLPWDQRPFEPLECFPEDFAPQHELALLDLQPRQLSSEQMISRLPVVRLLRSSGNMSLPAMLDRITPGAADGLLPHCHAVNDPLRGGRFNVQDLRVRMLTDEMYRELLLAWDRWPFKKSDAELTAEFSPSSLTRRPKDKTTLF